MYYQEGLSTGYLDRVSPILVYGGAICEASPSEAQSRKLVCLEEMKIVFIDLKWIKRKAKV